MELAIHPNQLDTMLLATTVLIPNSPSEITKVEYGPDKTNTAVTPIERKTMMSPTQPIKMYTI